VLDQLSIYIERDLEARRKIKSAITYPAIIVVMSLLTVVILASFVLPKFADFFESLDAELPLPTRMLMATTGFLSSFWWLLLAIAIFVTVWRVHRSAVTRPGRLLWHQTLLKLPVLGETVRYAIVERYLPDSSPRWFRRGVPLTEAMTVARDRASRTSLSTEGSGRRTTRWFAARAWRVRCRRRSCSPRPASQMIRVGEETGSLDIQLEVAAQYFERELDYKIKKVTSIIEPAVLLFSGCLVGFVAIALVSAMYGIFKTANLG
jgi:type IV pilus assembly protein PilC